MWDEEINKKIKDAADQYHPAYDDNAWDKMEQLLNEHLPRKKDRRRIIYFLPLVLLLAGIIFFVISRKETKPSSLLKSNLGKSQYEQNTSSNKVTGNPTPVKSGKNLAKDVKGENEVLKEISINTVDHGTKKIDKPSAHSTVVRVNRNTQLTPENLSPNNQGKQREDRPLPIEVNANGNSIKKNSANESINQPGKPSGEEIVPPVVADNNNPKVNTNITKDEKQTIKSKDVTKVENPKDANTGIKQKKTKKNFIQNFGIGLAFGPDVSAVRLRNTGKLTFTYGAELSYSFTDRFTLGTGFYVAKKIYSVDEDDYHIQSGSTGNYAYLQSVNANCKVYEIPVTLSYNFGKVKNHNWFASAGLSSYFMKKESYVYFYKYPSGNTENRSWTITNRNKHYFSVLDMSAGYEYSINKRFSIRAEPYVKLPLSGIGLGKIKLNSAGVLFTAAVKPFEIK
jgi:Outer membrane protein beta-barrel domain